MPHRTPYFEPLEPRLLLSADLLSACGPDSLDPLPSAEDQQAIYVDVHSGSTGVNQTHETPESPSPQAVWDQIIFLDPAINPDFQPENAENTGVLVVVLDAGQDGIRQISGILSTYRNLSAIHILSHGAPGQVNLVDAGLTSSSLDRYANDLTRWGESLTPDGDILLYGCSIAQGDAGLALMSWMAELTGADVAASVDATGAAKLGGDWVLERATGPIESSSSLAGEMFAAFNGLLAEGDLDPTFGTAGTVTSDFGGSDIAYSVAIQSDGKILVAGESGGGPWDSVLARYNTNGSLDTSFSGDGVAEMDLGGDDHWWSVAIQSDGKIVAAGHSGDGGNGDDFTLARYNTNGTLDTSFNGDGIATTDIGGRADRAYSVAIQSDGKIVVAGYSDNGSTWDFALARYDTNGSLDTSFSGDGILTTAIGSLHERACGMAIAWDGKIVVAGESYNGSNSDFAVARYNTNGTLDTSFNGDGIATTAIGSLNDSACGVAVAWDGKIVVTGYSDNGSNLDFALARYDTNGSLDTSFSGDGIAITAIGSAEDRAYSVVMQSDGKILATGYTDVGGGSWELALARYNSNGTLDTSFSGDGIVTTGISGNDAGLSAAIQSDGKIVAVGRSSGWDFLLARYDGGPAPAEVTVLGNGISIADGDTTPSSTDHTDFGSVVQGGTALTRTFTVRNDGGLTLLLGSVTVPTGFTLTEGLSGSLAAGASDTFTVRLDTVTAGAKSGDISFLNSDADGGDGIENPMNFRISGIVLVPPEVTVLGNGISIADGDTTPSSADHTNFGSVAQGTPGVSRVFTVRNDGELTLTLGPVTVPTGFTLTEDLSASLAPGASDTFTVRLDTVEVGAKSGDVWFENNDSGEDPFNFTIAGAIVLPEILVLGDPVTVPEGSTATFQVKLSVQPGSDTVVSVSRVAGDADITVSPGSSLTFTTSNWDTYQAVTLSAAEDVDVANGTATIRCSASGLVDKDVTAVEQDNDVLAIVTNKDSIAVPEGSTEAFEVKLSAQPASDVEVSVRRVAGDTDVGSSSPVSLIFTPSNWDTYQTVIVLALEDVDTANGTATIRCSASGLSDKDVTATEQDNDVLAIVTDKDLVMVPEGSTEAFAVKLSAQPGSDVEVSVRRVAGDTDLGSSSVVSLIFTPSNWDTYQIVIVSALEDVDAANGTATIRCSASGLVNKDVTAVELDNDVLAIVTNKDVVTVPEGSTNAFEVKLSAPPGSDVDVSVQRVAGDTDLGSSSVVSLVFTPSNWDTYQTVIVSALEDADTTNGTATIRCSAFGLSDKDVMAVELDNDSSLGPVYRFWSPVNSRHFYTIDETERDKLINNYSHVWTSEGVAYQAYADDTQPGVAPIYRFWSGTLNAHFYTMDQTERDKLINNYPHVWTYEGVAFYAYAAGSRPEGTRAVYRFWSGTLNCHFYTISQTERDKLINDYPHVWTYEEIAWYAYGV